jgi:Na+-transporting methylmalonyl-CoA/oxaloacetate decarboxylase gamma subunit
MVKFLVTSVVVLICLFLMALLLCLMVWVITRLLRFLFPQRFRSQAPAKKKKKKPSPAVTEEDEE